MPYYRLRIQGRLTADINLRFKDLTAKEDRSHNTVITGHVADQSALHGILEWLRDMNAPLLTVTQIADERVREKPK